MTSKAEALYHLQQIDLQIMQNRKRLKEIAEALEDRQVVDIAQGRVDAVEARLKPLRIKVRDLELEMQTNIQKSKASEDRLYSGSVKNPKEMQELQQEITALKKRNAELEDQLLEQMMFVESAEQELDEHNTALHTITQTWEDEHTDLLAEQKQIALETQGLKAKREAALQPVPAESLTTYDTLRKKKANQPIALLQGESCSVCGFRQTMANIQAVRRRDRLIPCENCGRILTDM